MLAFSEDVTHLDERGVQFARVGHERVAGVVLDHTSTAVLRNKGVNRYKGKYMRIGLRVIMFGYAVITV